MILNTPAAVPAHGNTWLTAVVTCRGKFITAIVTIKDAIALEIIFPQAHILTMGSTGEQGGVFNTVGAPCHKLISIIITMLLAITFHQNIQTNINTRPLTPEQMTSRTVVTLGGKVV